LQGFQQRFRRCRLPVPLVAFDRVSEHGHLSDRQGRRRPPDQGRPALRPLVDCPNGNHLHAAGSDPPTNTFSSGGGADRIIVSAEGVTQDGFTFKFLTASGSAFSDAGTLKGSWTATL